ncbi:nitrite/sulfite reductase [Cellulomonas fimi]|uniref:assimilatory sulfite reductase (ferredoxin) n=1 Tax=Cellulomonas fimi (strain ATCC 484 / DSM 20113 / JCM 1341 / CCUG 24087 / LMG 16345 / NBRC 15513 / NCIMB 8980 / NCTC 7547 / NRS-133) TaxID=590998 RepID=F4H0Z5_CELFA|nr:nitrite/sulfite reductase [Cellulomonas fimi]AEE46242.1 nitrite and sulphite reductase 4Fe-4S region [Cellulomonas fimi ATCC 484]NNH06181.1 nitrite/sulfite reductase [Cellulomonas fimi]VEH32203.1 Sulfite reductase [ferredoxin] [Cellulomonas fimi]
MAQTRIAPPAARLEGQWAFDQREPLNGNEQLKQEDDGLNVRHRIETIYAQQGFDSIPGDDLRGRMRWWGLYTQRKPGIDGGRTATLEPHELEDAYFMLRVRCDGGTLTLEQLRTVAGVSREFGRDTADITDRQNIQLHWVRIEDVPEIWRRLESVGLTTQEACGDVPRVILGSPVAGVAADEIIDGTPAIEEIRRRYIGDPSFSNLPRKFKTAVSGSPHQDVAHEINDVAFVGVQHPELGPGFDLWVGGALSTNPMLGKRLGAFVTLEQVPDVWVGVVSIFRDYGYRRLRTRARLKFLLADWGTELFRQVLEQEYLGYALADGPAPPPPPTGQRDHVGVHPQKDGRFYVGAAPTVGRVSGPMLDAVADLVEAAGSDRLQLTTEQKLVVLDVPADRVDALVDGLEALGLRVRTATPFRRGTIACTGIEFCKLAIVETKARAAHIVDELERRLPTFDQPITINVNGCPNSCARIQTADIGLKGALAQGEEGYQVHLGGGLGLTSGLGKTLRGLRVPSSELPDYLERVTRRFDEQRLEGELFAEWVHRAAEEDLR